MVLSHVSGAKARLRRLVPRMLQHAGNTLDRESTCLLAREAALHARNVCSLVRGQDGALHISLRVDRSKCVTGVRASRSPAMTARSTRRQT